VILASAIFDWSTVWQMDRQTELPWHISAIAYMLSCVKIGMVWSSKVIS